MAQSKESTDPRVTSRAPLRCGDAVEEVLGRFSVLAGLPRRGYMPIATPLQRMPRLGAYLGLKSLWIKRDDQLGLAGGGNKTRKLDFLVADAIASSADTLVTGGATQSNHCRLTASAAAKEGLRCMLVLMEMVPGSYRADAVGNNLFYELLGVDTIRVIPAQADLRSEIEALAGEAADNGLRPYAIPPGGSSPLGVAGYVMAAVELVTQAAEQHLEISQLFVATGSGGTQAGCILGSAITGANWTVQGISVGGKPGEGRMVLDDCLAEAARALQIDVATPPVLVDHQHIGDGYSLPDADMAEAVQQTARLEGVVLDPIYTGKAMAGLFSAARSGRVDSDETVVFLHTGGAVADHAYPSSLNLPVRVPGEPLTRSA